MANQAAVRSWWPTGDDGNGSMVYTVQYGITYNTGGSTANEAYATFAQSENATPTQLKEAIADAVRAHASSELSVTIPASHVLLQDGTRL
jgi:hypothetical protein